MNFSKFNMVHSSHSGQKMCSWIWARSKTTVFIQEISLLMSKEDVLIFRNCQSIWWGNLGERATWKNQV